MIRTARLVLEPLQPGHAEAMFPGLADARAYRFIPDDPPADVTAVRRRFASFAVGVSPDGQEIWLNWAVRAGAVFLGHLQATVMPAEAAALIAYQLFPVHWGQGFARESVAAMLAAITARHHLREARAYIDTRNAASIKLVESLGFALQDTISDADVFKGAPSDEYLYIKRLG